MLLLYLAFPLFGSAVARADDGAPEDPAEAAVLAAWETGEPIAARRAADARLNEDPESLVGRYVLGKSLAEDGDLSRARAELEHAERIWEDRYADATPRPWKVHVEVLLALVSVTGDVDDRDAQLGWIDAHDKGYNPKMPAERAWPLMKLGRYDEARDWAQRGIDSGDEWQGVAGYNALCAIAGESGDRAGAWATCGESRRFLPLSYDPAVALMNAAGAGLGVLAFAEAEEMLLEATRGRPIEAANPWEPLVWLYLGQGRGADAVAAARGMQSWRSRQPAKFRDQSRAELDGALAAVFLAAGDGARALSTADRSLDFPDRKGTVSGDAEQAMGRHVVIRLAARRLADRRSHEDVQADALLARLGYGLLRLVPSFRGWVDRSAVTAALTDTRRLRATLRLYVDGGLRTPPWLIGELIPVLGAGVVSAEVARIRATESESELHAYHDALDAECAWWRGARTEAMSLSTRALDALPASEKLLRARLAAIRADAAWAHGDEDLALDSYEFAMELDPGTVRRLGLAVPAEVRLSGTGETAEETAAILGRSPTLRSAAGAFLVTVELRGSSVRTCLTSRRGARLGCSETAPPTRPLDDDAGEEEDREEERWEPTPADHARAAAADFHAVVFALPLGGGGADLRSLDGTNVVRTEKARREMQGLLEGLDGG